MARSKTKSGRMISCAEKGEGEKRSKLVEGDGGSATSWVGVFDQGFSVLLDLSSQIQEQEFQKNLLLQWLVIHKNWRS